VSNACPYCRAGFELGEELNICSTCATPHHADCFTENGGCTVFGCADAPRDEPKISVRDQDLAAGSPPAATAPPPPPPGTVPPPPIPAPLSPGVSGDRLFQSSTQYAMPTNHPWYDYAPRKSRVVFVLLAVFLGAFGGHNFYAGYAKKGTIQICITLFTCFYGSFVSWIWAIVEACTVTHDDDGVVFN
jgi:TM2 domain-containing membrane protein YozV